MTFSPMVGNWPTPEACRAICCRDLLRVVWGPFRGMRRLRAWPGWRAVQTGTLVGRCFIPDLCGDARRLRLFSALWGWHGLLKNGAVFAGAQHFAVNPMPGMPDT